MFERLSSVFGLGEILPISTLSGPENQPPFGREHFQSVRSVTSPAFRWPSHNFRNTACPLLPWFLPTSGDPSTARVHSASQAQLRHYRITKSCVKSWSVGKVGRFASSAKSLPRRSRASPPALRTALRPTSFDEAGKRIGHLFRRLRSVSSRFSAGRSRP